MVGQRQTLAILPLGQNPSTRFTDAGWASGSVWTDVESRAPTGIQTRDRSVRSESLQIQRYPGQPSPPRQYSRFFVCMLVEQGKSQ